LSVGARLARDAFIHSIFSFPSLDEFPAIGFDCFRYLSNRNLSAHVETQYAPTPSQHSCLAQ
ncbi:hypothetical protein, partial [Pseudomonas sp. SBT1-2]|uniref:hypothetical protein n=1 Tax=Pseudomonas sp. SBT1-2 TaxID=3027852 RepID=UPI0023602DB3